MPRMAVLAGFAAQFVSAPDSTDAELIGRYVRDRDEAAIAAIVRRHGRSVHGVCRRILGNAADADDAFQATFLVLAKKAHRVAFHANVSAWLFAVAVRASRELLRRRSRRADRETTGTVPEREATDSFDFETGRIVLDEVAKLSDSYRAAVVLCELDGLPRADAARRLGIPEGTLSSRLAAARKLLATRLTARGITLAALAPLGGFVPPALAATVASLAVSSVVPSRTVSELMEVLMRTGVTFSAKKCLAALGVLAAVVGGFTLGEDPKPQPIQPAAAKVVEQDEPQSKLILTFREEVRYLTPEGKELQRISYMAAKKSDPELLTGSLAIGSDGVKLERYLPTCGQAGPGGIVPLQSHGTRLLTPGDPPSVKLLDSEPRDDHVVGWSADGKSFLVQTQISEGRLVSIVKHSAAWVDSATGTRERLPFDKDHRVIDVSADGQRYLTYRSNTSLLGTLGFSKDGESLCLLTCEGKVLHEAVAGTKTVEEIDPRLAPDGHRMLKAVTTAIKSGYQSALVVGDFEQKGNFKPNSFKYEPANGEVVCRAMAWSPDGKWIVSCWRPYRWWGKQTWHVVVCDADGKDMRKVSTFETKGDEQIRSLDWK